jgi:hypothetical protein
MNNSQLDKDNTKEFRNKSKTSKNSSIGNLKSFKVKNDLIPHTIQSIIQVFEDILNNFTDTLVSQTYIKKITFQN